MEREALLGSQSHVGGGDAHGRRGRDVGEQLGDGPAADVELGVEGRLAVDVGVAPFHLLDHPDATGQDRVASRGQPPRSQQQEEACRQTHAPGASALRQPFGGTHRGGFDDERGLGRQPRHRRRLRGGRHHGRPHRQGVLVDPGLFVAEAFDLGGEPRAGRRVEHHFGGPDIDGFAHRVRGGEQRGSRHGRERRGVGGVLKHDPNEAPLGTDRQDGEGVTGWVGAGDAGLLAAKECHGRRGRAECLSSRAQRFHGRASVEPRHRHGLTDAGLGRAGEQAARAAVCRHGRGHLGFGEQGRRRGHLGVVGHRHFDEPGDGVAQGREADEGGGLMGGDEGGHGRLAVEQGRGMHLPAGCGRGHGDGGMAGGTRPDGHDHIGGSLRRTGGRTRFWSVASLHEDHRLSANHDSRETHGEGGTIEIRPDFNFQTGCIVPAAARYREDVGTNAE